MLTSSGNSERTGTIRSEIHVHCFQLQILLFQQTIASFPRNIYRFDLVLNHSGNMFNSCPFIWSLHQRVSMSYLAVVGILVVLGRLLIHFTLESHLQIRALRRIPRVLWSRSYTIAPKLKSCSPF